LELVNLGKGLSVADLDALIGDRDHLKFLNTRNVLYRELGMKANPPAREQALRLMSENPNLIKRPLSVRGDTIVAGFAGDELASLCES
jgi:arsenate reductase-like glutaredoxin family protein